MEARELRIGNLVLYQGYHISTVHGITDPDWGHGIHIHYDNSCVGCAFDMVESITLTEEWLRKFGFKKMYNTELWNDYTVDCKLGEDDNNFYITMDKNVYYLGYDYDGSVDILNYHEIKSVHQLQNLYFALTGEELTIKDLV